MGLSDLIINRPKTVFFTFLVISLLIGLQTISLISNITMDPKDYLPSNAESIQILDEITTEMMGMSLLTFSTDMSAPSGNMTNITLISIYII
jgi:predicted RND superfamily exporter protein